VTQRLTDTKRWMKDYRESKARAAQSEPSGLFDDHSWTQPESATQTWRHDALAVIRRVAESRESFTVEDVRFPATVDNRSRGAALLDAARRDWIVQDGWRTGDRTRHGRPVRLWRSRVVTQ
jgi:hypothetical protein